MGKNLSNIATFAVAGLLLVLLSWIIYKQVREYHLQDDPMLHTLRELLKPVHPRFADIKLYKGDKSYTINKEKIFLCLYDEQGEYYPLNMIIHVLLHEISHLLNTKDVGHTEEFYRIFEEMQARATALGIYNPSIPIVKNYCGTE